jgi:RNA polymerase sigma-70 factor (ECF subfamily)
VAFLQAQVLREPGRFRLLPTTANGQPAFAAYQRESDGVYRAHGIMVLTIAASLVARTTMFMDPALLATFGLPPALPASGDPAGALPEGPDGTRAQNR